MCFVDEFLVFPFLKFLVLVSEFFMLSFRVYCFAFDLSFRVSCSSVVCFVFELWVPAVRFRVHCFCFGCFVFMLFCPSFSSSFFLFFVPRSNLGACILFSSSGRFLLCSTVPRENM